MDNILKELQELKNLTLLGVKEALTMEEAALFTGLKVSYLYQLTHRHKIPRYKSKEGGKLNFFSKKELTDWMLHHRIKTNDELETEAVNHCVTGKMGGRK